MIDKAEDVQADAIGMSGLLVKSTLIMRDNLEELNARGLAKIPVLLGGAALTRTYVERDLREIYEGRLFYGKDAFEGLQVMDRIGEIRRRGEELGDWGLVALGVQGARADQGEVRVRRRATGRPPDRSPEVAADNPVFVPPFLGSRVVKGIAIDDIAGYINETALFRNQWQFRPRQGRGRRRVQGAHPPHPARAARRRRRPTTCSCRRWSTGTSPPTATATTSSSGRTRRAPASWPASASPARAPTRSCASPTSSARSDSGEADYAAFHIVTMGAPVSERTAELFAADRYQDYLLLHGLGVEMAEALAEYWHRRIREEWGFADEDGPDLNGLFRQQYRGGRYSCGYPACPDLEDNEKAGSSSTAPASASRSARRRASSTSPSRPPPPSSATTPRPSTSSPGSRRRAPPVGRGLPLDRAWARVDSRR